LIDNPRAALPQHVPADIMGSCRTHRSCEDLMCLDRERRYE
jgi:hypothetical protein